jgi:uncharacterized damage-inducible protein DinB
MTQGAITSIAAPLAVIFTLNDGFITRTLEGMSDADLWHRPSDRGSPMLWMYGHIVHTRGAIARILGDDFRTGWGDIFQRGASLHDDRSKYPSRAEIERARAEVGTRLLARLASVTEEQLNQPASGPPKIPAAKTLADQIAFLGLHESYHVGQMAYVRRLLGHSGIMG